MNKVIFGVIIIVFLFIAQGLVRNTYSLWERQSLVAEARVELEQAQLENKELKAKLGVVREPGFSEREARNKLLYVKADEQIVLLPQTNQESSLEKVENKEPIWQQWVNLFL